MAKKAKTDHPLFVDRIKYILEREGLSQAELARRLKISRATVTEWMKRRSDMPRADVPFLIEERLGYSAKWVATGEGEPKPHRLDPTDTIIIENLPRLSADRKEAVRDFLYYQINRAT